MKQDAPRQEPVHEPRESRPNQEPRLYVLGFQDPDLTEVHRDSPTLSAASEALIMQWVASHTYRLISGDIKTAFPSGDEDVRNIFVSSPDDVRQMLNFDHEIVLWLRKAVYGLVNAPKKWWDRLKTSLIKHGFTSCALDPCAFVHRKIGKNQMENSCLTWNSTNRSLNKLKCPRPTHQA